MVNNTIHLLAILQKSLDRALFLYNFIREVRSSGVRESITIMHTRKFFKLHHHIVRFRFFPRIAKRSIPNIIALISRKRWYSHRDCVLLPERCIDLLSHVTKYANSKTPRNRKYLPILQLGIQMHKRKTIQRFANRHRKC